MMDDTDLFPGFATHRIAGPAGLLHVRVGGMGPALLCLHGYPQTHVCWHRVAPRLAETSTVVLMDLRGYGASDAPPGDPAHLLYSKREMARDCLAVMAALGFARFDVMGHDRGARVAYRLALDHPASVGRLIILDIVPTSEAWGRTTAASAMKAYHWAFLAQPAPMPETLIGGASRHYVDHTLASWTGRKSLESLDPRALAHYRALMADPARVHAVCEDYRAGYHVDRVIDEADRAAGRTIAAPTLVLWGTDYLGTGSIDVLSVWQSWAPGAVGRAILSGHFLVEENPDSTLAAIVEFFGL
ncbi:MAG: alpha/beta fold hydrolase [Hyphomicrobiaceae bacterium]